MHRTFAPVFCAAALLICAGCNTIAGTPKIQNVAIKPQPLHPGDTVLITVRVQDRHNVVARVEGVILDDPRATFPLFDDGTNGDEVAGDGIWTLQVVVPPHLPPGDFELEFAAYRNDGLPVEIRTKDKKVIPLKERKTIVVEAFAE